MSGEVKVCNHLQAQAASRATREPPVKRVSQVGRTLLPSQEPSASLVPRRCHRYK